MNFDKNKDSMEKIFVVPNGYTTQSYLKELVYDGLLKIYGSGFTSELKTRANVELQIINNLNYADYILVLWDTIQYAKIHNVSIGTGRGTAGSSLVLYGLGITEIDPLKYNLLFERFLNSEDTRQITIDVDCSSRCKIIEYLTSRYGANRVCSVIKKDLEQKYFAKPESIALNEHDKISPVGVIITNEPLDKIEEITMDNGATVILNSYKNTESKISLFGYRFNFIDLKELNLIDKTVRDIRKCLNIDININNIPQDDKDTFEMIAKKNVKDLFLLDSEVILNLLEEIKPESIEDLSAIIALCRPSPIASGVTEEFIKRKQHPIFKHKLLEPILKNTYGTIVYQEQEMLILQKILSCSLGQANNYRKNFCKFDEDFIKEIKPKFLENSIKLDLSTKITKEIFNHFVNKSFCFYNKSHSIAYATIIYRMAYLKCHYADLFNTNIEEYSSIYS